MEWCLNEYQTPANIATSGEAPRVVRGGSWDDNQWFARCAYRNWNLPTDFFNELGFRVVLSLANPAS
jgi:formylglycine-generating enzyme required for sulfatase activity